MIMRNYFMLGNYNMSNNNVRKNLKNTQFDRLSNNLLNKINSELIEQHNKNSLKAALGFDIQTLSFARQLNTNLYRIIQWSNTRQQFITKTSRIVDFIREGTDTVEPVDSKRLILKLGFHKHGGKIYVADAQLQYVQDVCYRPTYYLIKTTNDSGGGIFVTHRVDSLNKKFRYGKVNRTTIIDRSFAKIRDKVKIHLRIKKKDIHFIDLNLNA